jgi:hypothetical protein
MKKQNLCTKMPQKYCTWARSGPRILCPKIILIHWRNKIRKIILIRAFPVGSLSTPLPTPCPRGSRQQAEEIIPSKLSSTLFSFPDYTVQYLLYIFSDNKHTVHTF